MVGAGACGARAGRQLVALEPLDDLVLVDPDRPRAEVVAESLGDPARVADEVPSAEPGDVVLLAAPAGQRDLAFAALVRGAHVVSTADAVAEVRALLELDATARANDAHLVVGAGFAPGLSCVLVALAARSLEKVDEVHVAKMGTAGPACARQHHRALGGQACDWRDGEWAFRSGGSGRELCWFPEPVGAADCYRAALPDALLLAPALPGVRRVTARLAANRRDRLTARLPMMRRPHAEGDLGAIRVEVRGTQGSSLDERVLGAVDRPAVATGAVAALACRWAAEGRLARTGAAGLASLVEPGSFLAALAERGVKVAVFEGGRHGEPSVPPG